jgi:hypothetical protein
LSVSIPNSAEVFVKRSTASARVVAASSARNRTVRTRACLVAAIEPLEQRTLMSTIPVTTLADDGSAGSLRAALAVAQDGDTIDASGITGTIALTSGPLTINADVAIVGPGAGSLTISGQGISQVFVVAPDETGSISGLTITAGGGSASGGAISTDGNLILNNVAITASTASAAGGAIYEQGGTLTIANSTLSNNGISGASGDAAGGAIYIAAGTATLTNCTLSQNQATGATLGGNASGGAIYLGGNSLSLMNDTVAGNTAAAGIMGAASGGGIATTSGTGLTMQNTILANNVAAIAADLAVAGSVTDWGHNLLGSATSGFTSGVNGDLVGVDPLLSALAGNGGPTQTMAIAPDSPARDAGSAANSAPTADQRGEARSGPTDIGAYEYQDAAPTFSSTAVTSATAGTAYSYSVTTSDSDGDAMTITAGSLPAWLTLTATGNGTATLSGTPAAGDVGSDSISLSVSDGVLSCSQNFTLAVAAAPVLSPTLSTINTFAGGSENTAYTMTYSALLAGSNAADPNGLPVSFLITSVDSGSLTLNGSAAVAGVSTLSAGASVVWTPAAGASGTLDAFSVEATDGTATSTPAVAVDVQVAASLAPVAANDSFNTISGVAVSGNVLNNDTSSSGSALSALVQTQPTHGTLMLSTDGDFTYLPAVGFVGSDSFTYVASDGTLTSNAATVSITVAAAVQPGEFDFSAASESVLSTAGSTTLTVDRNNNATGATSVDYAVTGGTAVAGTDYVVSNGTLNFAAGQTTASVVVEIPAGAAASNDVTLVLTLSNPTGGNTVGAAASTALTIQHVVPEVPPVAVADSFTTAEATALSGNVLGNDSSPMGKSFTAVLQQTVSHGTLTLHGNGDFSYTPAAGFVGTDSFTYADNDGTATGNVVSVSITVTAAPVTPPVVTPPVTPPVTPITVSAGSFGFGAASQSASNLDGSVTVTVNRSGGSSGLASVDYAATGGTAVAGTDYTVAAGKLTFADGQTSATFAVQIAAVGAGEADKTIVLTLSNPTAGAALGSTATDTITISHVADTTPTAGDIAVTRAPGAASVINLLSKVKAANPAALTISIVSNPAYGSVTVLPNSVPGTFDVLYTPTPSYSVNDSFQYQVADGKGGVVRASVNITVFGAGLMSIRTTAGRTTWWWSARRAMTASCSSRATRARA